MKKTKLTFDARGLARAILDKRIKDNLSFRDVEKSHGIAGDKLYRLEATKAIPRADTLAAVCEWLETNPNQYFKLK